VLINHYFQDEAKAQEALHWIDKGCILDFNGYKEKVDLKILTARICPDCLTTLLENNPDPNLLAYFRFGIERIRQDIVNGEYYKKIAPQPVPVYLRKEVHKRMNYRLEFEGIGFLELDAIHLAVYLNFLRKKKEGIRLHKIGFDYYFLLELYKTFTNSSTSEEEDEDLVQDSLMDVEKLKKRKIVLPGVPPKGGEEVTLYEAALKVINKELIDSKFKNHPKVKAAIEAIEELEKEQKAAETRKKKKEKNEKTISRLSKLKIENGQFNEFKNNAYYFITDAGEDYKVVLKGDKKVEVSFMARGENNQPKDDITGTGDSRKVFGTVINIVKDYVGQKQPDILLFAADNSEPSRVRLYNMLASQASKALPGYNFAKAMKGGMFTTFYLTRDGINVPKLDTAKNLAGRALDKIAEDNVSSHRKEVNEEFKSVSLSDAIMDFLPIAKAHLKLEKLPKIKLVTKIGDSEVPTFGKYNNMDKAIHVAKGKRHPVDIIRTLAHELVHYAQGQNNKLRPGDSKDGSPIEDEANSEAGVMLRKFSKKYPQYIKKGKPE
jgi:hypothetical protein